MAKIILIGEALILHARSRTYRVGSLRTGRSPTPTYPRITSGTVTEILDGIPYTLWMALPKILHLKGGDYRSSGFLYEPGPSIKLLTAPQ
jgi:hypothetical protein